MGSSVDKAESTWVLLWKSYKSVLMRSPVLLETGHSSQVRAGYLGESVQCF